MVSKYPLASRTSPAARAAGVIHSDIEKGFIKAEFVSYDDMVQLGSFPAAKAKGVLRLEGKEYRVREGDVIEIDIPGRRLSLALSEEELAERRAEWKPLERPVNSMFLERYRSFVTSGSQGAVFRK